MAAAVFLSALIVVVSALPIAFPGAIPIEFHAKVEGSAPTSEALRRLEAALGPDFQCRAVDPPPGGEDPSNTLRCAGVSEDDEDLVRMEEAARAEGLRLADGIGMTTWVVPSTGALAAAVVVYVAIAVLLVRRTSAGWGAREARLLRWRALPLVVAPIATAWGLSFLVGAMVEGVSPAPTASGAPPMATWLFAVLPIAVALPEEALFRGWLHERLFASLPPWVAYLLVAELFLLMHFVLAGPAIGALGAGMAAFHAVVIVVVSLVLTWVRRVGGSVALCVIAHAAYNATAVGVAAVAA